jgi:hypothetical protein
MKDPTKSNDIPFILGTLTILAKDLCNHFKILTAADGAEIKVFKLPVLHKKIFKQITRQYRVGRHVFMSLSRCS